jgi:pimeloyl-ACP methyl ester carboxylesterase
MNPVFSDSRGFDFQRLGCHSRSWGEGTRGPGLLCLHGLGDWGTSFDRLAETPALGGFRILAPDLPGYGHSPRPTPALSLQELAEGFSEALAHPLGEAAVLLGHSMGGTLAQLIAERCPERIRAVVVVEGNTCLNDCSASGPVASRSLRTFLETGFSELLSQLDEGGREDLETARYAASLRLADPVAFHRHAGDLVALSRPADLPRRLAALPIPTLYIAGSPGGIGPLSTDLLRQAGVNLQVLSPAGHCPHRDLPEEFARSLADFLLGAGIAP